ncbi:MAG: universal stress protein [Nitriliruptoraceae bacterium]
MSSGLPDAVIVPLDDTAGSLALLPIARRLADRFRIPLHRVTVTSESGEHSDAAWQAQSVALSLLAGEPVASTAPRAVSTGTARPSSNEHTDHVGLVFADGDIDLVLRGGRRAPVLLAYLADRGQPLLCIASGGHGTLQRRLAWVMTQRLLAEAPGPVLVTGPQCDPRHLAGPPATLVLAVGLPFPVPVVENTAVWARALDAHVEVVGSDTRPVDAAIDRVRAHGVRADGSVLVRSSTTSALLERAAGLAGPALIVGPPPPGESGGGDAFDLVQRSPWPVLASFGTAAELLGA